MNVNCIVSRTIRLAEPTKKITLHEPLAYNNQFAHAMQVVVVDDDNQPVELTGVSVVGTFLNNDGVTVDPIVGAVDGNVASVLLPPGCYVCPGWYRFTMNLVSGDASRTVLWVEGMVERNVSGNISDPGTPVGNIEQAVGNANAAAAAANTAAANATKHVAPTEAASTASADHAVGEYFVYGGKLYVTMSAISAGDTITPDTNCEEVPDGLGSEVSELKGHFPATGKFVTGTNTSATEENAVAEGEDTIASGLSSHAEGYSSEASGDYSHSEGGSVASGGYSHAEGSASEASGDNAHAEGYETTASSDNSHSEGWGTTASGMNAHAEGVDTVASGNQSHAEGEGTIANHAAQSVSGTYNVADPSQAAATAKGNYAEIVGNGTSNNVRSNARTLDWSGNEELAGDLTIKKGGTGEKKVSVIASDVADLKAHFPSTNFKVGTGTSTTSTNCVAEGDGSTASNQNAHAEGNGSVASGKNAHAEGGWNVGVASDPGKRYSTASGTSSHAEGSGCHAEGTGTHAEGVATTATGEGAHSEGRATDAHGTGSHAEGYNTIAQYNYQHVSGQFNAVETGAEIVGNGTDSENRKNIRVLDWNGNEKLAGSLTLGYGTADEVTITAAQLKRLLALLS